MRYCHEPGERGASEDAVVLRGPVDDLKVNALSPKVLRRAEDDIEVDFDKGIYALAWDDAVECCV